ncbi:MAG: hypothetical protein RLZZ58_704 [Pseudomonadota bacterium]
MAKKILKGAVLGAVVAALGLSATTANAAQETATAKARILAEIQLTNTSDLEFATIISGAQAGSVVVSTAGAVTCGTTLVCTGTTTAADFDIQGTDGAVVLISGDTTVTLTETVGGTATMDAALNYSTASVTLNAGPASVGGSFSVGGTLDVDANQESGAYEGTFNVTANYQ